MVNDYLQHKAERDRLLEQLSQLQKELLVEKDNVDYYRELLRETRSKILVIRNLSGAETVIADSESVDSAWDRNIQTIITKLKGGDK